MLSVKMLRLLVFSLGCLTNSVIAQNTFSIENFEGAFDSGSGVLRSLNATSNPDFDFSPSDVFDQRNGPNQYHTGDLTFRYREAGQDGWLTGDSSVHTADVSSSTDNGLLTTSMNDAMPNIPSALKVTRTWQELDGDLALSFDMQNTGSSAFEIGSLGMPIEFNNIFTNRSATQTTARCVLIDPYIGMNAGYVQVTRLTGTGPSLVVTPLNSDSKFEGWRFLPEPEGGPLGYQIQTYEGNYAWEVFTQAYAENEWQDAEPWNPPTSHTLGAGESITVGLRFSASSDVQHIEDAVSAAGLPYAVGIPGYILPQDLTAKLFLNTDQKITSTNVSPSGALEISSCGKYGESWTGYNVRAGTNTFGRARLEITYADDTVQVLQYWVANESPQALSQFGSFLTNEQYFTDPSDPFGRSPSVITYNRATEDYVDQDNRTWIAGVSDEGGAGSFLAAGMKQSVWPNADEVAKLEDMVHGVVWGNLQLKNSGNETYGVKRSLFWYQPELVPNYQYDPYFNWSSVPFPSQDKEAASALDRTYNYVHVSALYWGLYRAGRTHPDMLTQQTPDWYLLQAYHTVAWATSNSSAGIPHTGYIDVGLMVEWVWGDILSDLYAEGYNQEGQHMEDLMRARQNVWANTPDPFGSEMAWDSTGEEGVYYWSHYFNDEATAQKSVRAIRGYMPTIPHWGYNGNARRYWDFIYAGEPELAGIERQIHHYGSGLNSLPILENYRGFDDPESLESLYDLRIAYGGNQGPLSNIDAGGFGAMAFHSYPSLLRWDAYSGDYGPNFAGHVMGAATYLVNHPVFGYVSFGGNVATSKNGVVTVEPKDAVRKRIFIAPLSLYVTIDAGTIGKFTYSAKTGKVVVSLMSDSDSSQTVTMKWQQTNGQSVQLATKGLKPRLDGLAVNAPGKVTFTAS